jgi:DNA polymerase zeta
VLARDCLVPDPTVDSIVALSFAFYIAEGFVQRGSLFVRPPIEAKRLVFKQPVEVVDDELSLLNRIVDIVNDLDPDILVGWDVQRFSWGYLDTRGKVYGMFSPSPLRSVFT